MPRILFISQNLSVPNQWETFIPTGRFILGEFNKNCFMPKKNYKIILNNFMKALENYPSSARKLHITG
jgi:hypothetical protein